MKFNLETMLGVVEHYASQRCQDPQCKDCRFLPYDDEDATIPDGYEPVRGFDLLVHQCEKHNVPLFPWLRAADPEKAAQWLVEQSEGKQAFQADFAAWERALS